MLKSFLNKNREKCLMTLTSLLKMISSQKVWVSLKVHAKKGTWWKKIAFRKQSHSPTQIMPWIASSPAEWRKTYRPSSRQLHKTKETFSLWQKLIKRWGQLRIRPQKLTVNLIKWAQAEEEQRILLQLLQKLTHPIIISLEDSLQQSMSLT